MTTEEAERTDDLTAYAKELSQAAERSRQRNEVGSKGKSKARNKAGPEIKAALKGRLGQ